jgi:hypothetical protein
LGFPGATAELIQDESSLRKMYETPGKKGGIFVSVHPTEKPGTKVKIRAWLTKEWDGEMSDRIPQ